MMPFPLEEIKYLDLKQPESGHTYKEIQDKIPPYQERLEVGLLIGCNCPQALKPREVITGKADDPYAIRTLLGGGIILDQLMSSRTNLKKMNQPATESSLKK